MEGPKYELLLLKIDTKFTKSTYPRIANVNSGNVVKVTALLLPRRLALQTDHTTILVV